MIVPAFDLKPGVSPFADQGEETAATGAQSNRGDYHSHAKSTVLMEARSIMAGNLRKIGVYEVRPSLLAPADSTGHQEVR